jgi:ABC-type polar amino acid transport system ATPase subunit
MIIINKVGVSLHGQQLLQGVSMALVPGVITSIIGKSGAGKTTLLKSIIGLVPISAGVITINGRQLKELSARQRAKAVGYVFQDFNLFPHCTVLENCINPLLVHKMPYKEARETVLKVLSDLAMTEYVDRYPSQLSGGQQQRVAIARALVLNPSALLLDEPTASLDPANTDLLVALLKVLAQRGLTIVLSSQDMSFVNKVIDRVYYMEHGVVSEFCENRTALEKCPTIKGWLYDL